MLFFAQAKLLYFFEIFCLQPRVSQNVSEEKTDHQEEAAGEDISVPSASKLGGSGGMLPQEILKISFSKTPFSCNLSDQTLILSPKYGLYYGNFLTKMFAKFMVFNALGKLITVIVPCG